jgi:hypothetical protein
MQTVLARDGGRAIRALRGVRFENSTRGLIHLVAGVEDGQLLDVFAAAVFAEYLR